MPDALPLKKTGMSVAVSQTLTLICIFKIISDVDVSVLVSPGVGVYVRGS